MRVAVLDVGVLTVCASGASTRGVGFQHERMADIERLRRRHSGLLMVAAGLAVLVGLPGLQPFLLGSRRIAGLTFMRFVVYGKHPQSISIDGIALLIALLALVGGFAAAWLWYGPANFQVSTGGWGKGRGGAEEGGSGGGAGRPGRLIGMMSIFLRKRLFVVST